MQESSIESNGCMVLFNKTWEAPNRPSFIDERKDKDSISVITVDLIHGKIKMSHSPNDLLKTQKIEVKKCLLICIFVMSSQPVKDNIKI